MTKIVFLTRSMSSGGAERQICVLAAALAQRGYGVSIVTFYAPHAHDVAPKRVRVVSLDKRSRWDVVGFGLRLLRILRAERPDLLHPYLPACNCIAALLRPLLPPTRLVFALRATRLELERYGWLERSVRTLERWLAPFAELLIANAEAVRQDALAAGYPTRIVVVSNGIDVGMFQPLPEARRALRTEWNIAEHHVVIGVVGRLDPMKDHESFLAAFAEIAARRDDVWAVIVGSDAAGRGAELRARAAALGISNRVLWFGERSDIAAVYNAIDLLCLPSAFGEGFPNVIGEAMACGIPCVATDVGAAAEILGNTGRLVAPCDPPALASALRELVELTAVERHRLGQSARTRILSEFSVDRLAEATTAVLAPLLKPRSR